jgi:hypothetical protein
VRIDHPERTLRATYADYFEREDRLFARGSVEFVDRIRGNELYGDTLNLLEAGTIRNEQEVRAVGRPAVAVFYPNRDDAAADSVEVLPYRVSADQIRILGEQLFWGDGNAQVERDSLFASADSLAFDQSAGVLQLNLSARMIRGDLEMFAPLINLFLPVYVLQLVELFRGGEIRTVEMVVGGDVIRLQVDNDQVQRLVAVRRTLDSGDPDRRRPYVLAEQVFVTADSIDVLSPGEILQSMTATGQARLETRGNTVAEADTAAVRDPDDPNAVLSVEDWMEGQVIVATFVQSAVVEVELPSDSATTLPESPDVAVANGALSDSLSASDAATLEYVLDRLTATGNARSWYRAPPEGVDPATSNRRTWGVSYLLADEIFVQLTGGTLDWIEAVGSVRGLQLEPIETPEPAPVITEEGE